MICSNWLAREVMMTLLPAEAIAVPKGVTVPRSVTVPKGVRVSQGDGLVNTQLPESP